MNYLSKLILFSITITISVSKVAAEPISELVIDDNDFYSRNSKKELLGKLLMFDKILSGNKNIACASCHHPYTFTGDGLSLSVGEGGTGLGILRDTGAGKDAIIERVPRNAPPIFNLGAKEFTKQFHDGRVEVDPTQPGGFRSPAGPQLPEGLDNVLAAQALFPVTSATEMAGQSGENQIADAAHINKLSGENGVWDLIVKRLQNNTEYEELFINTFDDVQTAKDINIVHVANSIAAFEAIAWRCTESLFDRYVKNPDETIVSAEVMQGADVFYNPEKGNCVSCHNGPLQTDHQFHAIGVPQIGPGKGDNQDGYADGRDDFGRERVTGLSENRYQFRTPSLRQVALTGPWGHDGAFNNLEAMIRHHLNPVQSLLDYDKSQAVLPSRDDLDAEDFAVQDDTHRLQEITQTIEIKPISLSDEDISYLIKFLEQGLTDFNQIDLRKNIPTRVPSGLPVYD